MPKYTNIHESKNSDFFKTLVFTNDCLFKTNLIEVLNEHDIAYQILKNTPNFWIRDYMFEGHTSISEYSYKLYVRSKNILTPSLSKIFRIKSQYINRQPYNGYGNTTIVPKIHKFNSNFGKNLIKDTHMTSRTLEGGNYFQAENSKGEVYHLIGKNVAEFELWRWEDKFNSKIKNKENYCFISARKRYAKIFNCTEDKVIILPQWAYHLDLQMSYIGNSTFFVHSFEETDNFIDKYISSMHRLKYRATVLSDSSLVAKLKKAESIVEKNIQTLKSVGFKVIKMCGILHKSHEKINNFSIGEAESNIINGIDVYSPKYKKSLFITTNTHIPEHKQYCSDLLNNNGICPEFINMDDDSISNFRFNLKLKNGKKVTMNSTILNTILATCTPNQINEIRAHCTQLIMSLYHGGLRCQTNFISPDFLVS